MADSLLGGTLPTLKFAGPPKKKRKKKKDDGPGLGGFIGNLAGDVKDAVVGLPKGLIETGEAIGGDVFGITEGDFDFSRSRGVGGQIAGATWQTWSPLFHGDFGKFARGIYDHPLAPILDVATVFTLGAGGVARGAQALSKAGVQSSKVSKVASLREGRTVKLTDPLGQRHDIDRNLSRRPGRRLVQETFLRAEPHLPAAYVTRRRASRYEHAFVKEMQHREHAKNEYEASALQAVTFAKAAEAMGDPATSKHVMQGVLAHNYVSLLANAPRRVAPEEAARLIRRGEGRYVAVKNAAEVDPVAKREYRKALRQMDRWEKQRAAHAEAAHALPKIQEELAAANATLADLFERGHVVAGRGGTNRPGTKKMMDFEYRQTIEQQQLVKRLERQKEQARVSKKIHDRAVTELERLTSTRVEYERGRSFRQLFDTHGADPEPVVRNFGRHVTTRRLGEAARDSDGNVYLVPLQDVRNLERELASSVGTLKKMYREGTSWWKSIMIGYTPRSFTNNFIGGWAMYATRQGGDHALQGIIDGLRIAYGQKRVNKMLGEVGGYRRKQHHWTNRFFATELQNTFRLTLGNDPVRPVSRKRQGIYPLVHRFADEPVRRSALVAFMRSQPEVKQAMKELKGQGGFDRAVTRAIRKHPELRRRAEEHVRSIAGDYVTIRRGERTVRDLVPFYLWNRHIVKTTANLFADQPLRAAAMQRISNMGIEETEEFLGQIPDFLKGAIPFGDKKAGRASVLLTHTINPFATIADLSGAAEGALVGDRRGIGSLVGNANPLIGATIEQVSGRDTLTGAPAPQYGGLLTSLLIAPAMELPPAQLAKAVKEGTKSSGPSGKPFLYEKSPKNTTLSLLGVPIRNVSLERAGELYREDEGITSSRKARRKKSQFLPELPKTPAAF